MSSITISQAEIETTVDGRLLNLDDWNRDVAQAMAEHDHIQLTDAHWDVINIMRDFYSKYNISPIKKLLKNCIREKLDDTKVTNWNTDFGLYYRTGFRSLRLAMIARNFGPDTEFQGFSELYGLPQSVRMPLNFRLGVGYDIIEPSDSFRQRLTAYLEGVHPNDGPERVHAALEYNLLDVLSLRGGYKFNYDEQGLTFGGGVDFNMGGMGGRIDYAYLDYGRLTNVHLFTIVFRLL